MTIEEEYQETRKKSKSLYDRAGKVMPSGIEHDSRFIRPFPFYVERAEGARKWDIDGNELIDLWSGHGLSLRSVSKLNGAFTTVLATSFPLNLQS